MLVPVISFAFKAIVADIACGRYIFGVCCYRIMEDEIVVNAPFSRLDFRYY